MDQIHHHLCETVETHAEDLGELSHEIPVDLNHGDNFHGEFFSPDVLECDEGQHDTAPVTPVTCSVNRMETRERRIANERHDSSGFVSVQKVPSNFQPFSQPT